MSHPIQTRPRDKGGGATRHLTANNLEDSVGGMPTLSFHASAAVDRQIRREARRRGLPVSRVLKEVVDRGLKEDKKSFGEWARCVAGTVNSGEGDLSMREGFGD